YRQPDVWCFTAPVKQRKDELPQVTFVRRPTAASIAPNQGIYIGEEEVTRRPSIAVVPPPKPPRTDRAVLDEKRRREMERRRQQESEQRKLEQTEATPFLPELVLFLDKLDQTFFSISANNRKPKFLLLGWRTR
ncbi:hypothetical protein ANCDUO_14457, partial [Ancylostoma duodenale]